MDTAGNLLTALANAQRVGKDRLAVPYVRFHEQLLQLLQARGVVASVRAQRTAHPLLVITLSGTQSSRRFRRVSRPGRRQYVNFRNIPWSSGPASFYVISTSRGLMEGEAARRARLGGEIVCEVR